MGVNTSIAVPGIFISYRRDDSQGFAGRLADDLSDILGKGYVFRDVEIPIGHDFTQVLHKAVASCSVLIVVIGRNWQSAASGPKSRLFEPTDWVRAEIEAAFELNKKIIPVLVGGATMCLASDLPKSISLLSNLRALVISDRGWDSDIQKLAQLLKNEIPDLKSRVPEKQESPKESLSQILLELGERALD